ncbi:hypothetical protein [Actinotalea solisilvae]|uniref:hypothetical protein n=1 Tax=Actinotalea solisilvae TaxID=2072922 RepID=UPI0018F2104D|nr:hypothetical protein [Actinotalea solisilvae]
MRRTSIPSGVAVPAVLPVLAASVVLGGCTPDPGVDRRDEVGRLVSSWSEADHAELGDLDRTRPALVLDAEDLDDVTSRWPDDVTLDGLDVDLDAPVLVVGAWARCTESSRVVVDDDRTTLTLQVVDPQEQVACGWSPVRLEVWEISRSELGDGTPRLTGYGRGQAAGGGQVRCPEPARC